MKNNGVHQVPHLRLFFQNWQSCLKEKYALGRTRTPVKSKDSGQM